MKKKHKGFSIRFYFVLSVMVVYIISSGVAAIATTVVNEVFGITLNIPPTLWVFFLSILMGAIFTLFVSRWIFEPIRKMRDAMSGVAKGNFGIHLETESRISEIKECYEAFNLMSRELGTTETLQSDFVSNVSHELKTPINAIEGYSMLLQNENVSGEDKRVYVDKILFNTRRLSSLVGNILLLSKLENQAIHAPEKVYRLDEQIRQALLMHETAWTQKDLEFEVELEPIDYQGSEQLLIHVWSNLISNAIKFSPEGGTVKLWLYRQGEGIYFRVEDEGPGIPAEDRDKIFGRFYQGNSSREGEGNGLGLALVKRVLDLTGGSITVEDGMEIGTRFTVRLEEKS